MGNGWDNYNKVAKKSAVPNENSQINLDSDPPSKKGGVDAPKMTNFDSKFGNVSAEFKQHFNWEDIKLDNGETTKNPMNDVFMNALNGRYKSMITKHGHESGYMNDQFKALGEKSWEIAKYIKTTDEKLRSGKLTEQEAQSYESNLVSMREDFYKAWTGASKSIYFDEKNKPREKLPFYLTDDNMLQSKEEYGLADFGFKVRSLEKFGTNKKFGVRTKWETNFFIPTVTQEFYAVENPNGAYNSVVYNEGRDRDALRDIINPIVETWITKGFQTWDKGATATEKNDNMEKTTAALDHMLGWVSKHGSHYKDLKKTADDMMKAMEGMDFQKKRNYIKNNMEGLTEITKNLGFYGSQEMYKKFGDKFNDPRYYQGSKPEEREQSYNRSLNEISTRLRLHKEFTETSNGLRQKAYTQLIDNLDFTVTGKGENEQIVAKDWDSDMQAMVYKNVKSQSGNIRSFNKVMDEMAKAYGERGSRIKSGFYPNVRSETVWEESETIGGKEYGGGKWVTRTFKNEGYTRSQLKEAYDNVVKGYKSTFGEINVASLYDYTAKVAGMSYKRSQMIGHDNIKLTIDNPKTSNVNRILSIVDSQDLGSDIITKKGDVYISHNAYNPAISQTGIEANMDSESWTSKHQQKYYDAFFKDKDAVYDLDFSRESPLSGKSAYTFRKKGSDKVLTLYIDRNVAQKAGEDFVSNTSTSSSDWSFNTDGVWDMSYAEGKGKSQKGENLKIVHKDGSKFLYGSLWDQDLKDGKGDFRILNGIELGPNDMLPIRKAEAMVQDILRNIKRSD